jgi:hypothetical protein
VSLCHRCGGQHSDHINGADAKCQRAGIAEAAAAEWVTGAVRCRGTCCKAAIDAGAAAERARIAAKLREALGNRCLFGLQVNVADTEYVRCDQELYALLAELDAK